MAEWLWVLDETGAPYLIDEDDGDTAYHADLYPDAVYFLAGVSPVPLED